MSNSDHVVLGSYVAHLRLSNVGEQGLGASSATAVLGAASEMSPILDTGPDPNKAS